MGNLIETFEFEHKNVATYTTCYGTYTIEKKPKLNQFVVSVNMTILFTGSGALSEGVSVSTYLQKKTGGIYHKIDAGEFDNWGIIETETSKRLTNGESETFTGSATYAFKEDGTTGIEISIDLNGKWYSIGLLKASNGHIKKNDVWKNSWCYRKNNNTWKKSYIWKKINGIWKRGV